MTQNREVNVWYFLIAIVIPNAGIWIVAALSQDRNWFQNELVHPSWRPSNWLFPVIWTIVYSLMGIASYNVFQHGEGVLKLWVPLGVYAAQLLVNWFWTMVFSIWHLILPALYIGVILWLLVVLMIVIFWRVKIKAALYLFPYIAWLTVAVALNAHYYQLNKDSHVSTR